MKAKQIPKTFEAVRLIFIMAVFLSSQSLWSQNLSVNSDSASRGQHMANDVYEALMKTFGKNKILPQGYEEQVILALSHFPELKDSHIQFRLHPSHATLRTRIDAFSLLKKRDHRYYVITISSRSIEKLKPIMFSQMNFSAQVGILGHEISHVFDFSKKNFLQCVVTGARHLRPEFVDSLEFHTDLICIRHGLGKELEAWSRFVRTNIKVKNWRGSDYVNQPGQQQERYMNPDTIEKVMAKSE